MVTNNPKNSWGQEIADNLNWNVLLEYYQDKKDTDEFKLLSSTEIEEWFLKKINTQRVSQRRNPISLEEGRKKLKLK